MVSSARADLIAAEAVCWQAFPERSPTMSRNQDSKVRNQNNVNCYFSSGIVNAHYKNSRDGEMKAEGAMIFMVVFFVALLVTYYMFDLFPGRELAGLLGISVADSAGTGVRTNTLLVGLFNGIIYGATALLVYSLARSVPGMLGRDKNS